MKITRFEDIEAWQLARRLCQAVGKVASKDGFARCHALKDQIERASGSAMDNIAEGFDGGSHAEFARFLADAQRSCLEVQSQLYRAQDRGLISRTEFDDIYQLAKECHGKIGGFIRCLKKSGK